MSLTTIPEYRAVGGWHLCPDPPAEEPLRKGCPGQGKDYRQWEIKFHRDADGTVTPEHSLGIDPVTRGRAEAKAHQRTRVERIRARLAKRLAEKEEKAGWEEVD